MASEPGLPRRAKATAHRATDLAADAPRDAVGIQHQHGLDPLAVVQLPQVLHRVAPVAESADDDLQRRLQSLTQRRPQRLRNVGHLRRRGQVLIQPLPDLIHPVPRLVLEQCGELGAARLVQGRRHTADASSTYSSMCRRNTSRLAVQNDSSVTSKPNTAASSSAVFIPARDKTSSYDCWNRCGSSRYFVNSPSPNRKPYVYGQL